jgi:acetyl-CoA acyltransferase
MTQLQEVFICDAIRTPIGRYGGILSGIRTDDLGAIPIKALMERNPQVAWKKLDEVIYGNVNQAGEDNRNVARMSSLLSGMPYEVPGATVNRLCGSGMEAIGVASRAIATGQIQMAIAGGVESMSRAPFVMPKADAAFSRNNQVYDTTIGWRFINPMMQKMYGVDSMPETAQNVADDFGISRADQDAFAVRSQQKAIAAQNNGRLGKEITPVSLTTKKGEVFTILLDEHPRATTMEVLQKLKPITRPDGSVTAGNSSGVNDGACALLLANSAAMKEHQLKARAKIHGLATAGVPPRIMGIGPAPASKKLLAQLGLTIAQMDVIELNEAFASQGIATLRDLGVADDDIRVNPNGGAIALGHPLGMSGARLVTTALHELEITGGRYALCTMCIGVGQGIAIVIERV